MPCNMLTLGRRLRRNGIAFLSLSPPSWYVAPVLQNKIQDSPQQKESVVPDVSDSEAMLYVRESLLEEDCLCPVCRFSRGGK